MPVDTNGSAILQLKLQEEADRLHELLHRVQQRAKQTEDVSELGEMERALTSALESIERVVEVEEVRQRSFSPIVESQEISLPTFPFPGKREPVNCREEGPRLPDTGAWIVDDVSNS